MSAPAAAAPLGLVKAIARQLPAILGVALLIGAVYVVQREFRSLRLHDIETALADIPLRALAIGFGATVLSYAVLTIYDRLGTIYAGHKVAYGRVAFASFCAYALSHNLGFAAVSGAAVRYRLYEHWGLTPLQIAKTVAFCSLTFALGGMVLGGSILFIEPRSIPFFGTHLPHAVMYAAGAVLWACVIGYLALPRALGGAKLFGHELTLPGRRMAVLQVLLATIDVAITASIFFVLLPHTPRLTWAIFLGVYVSAYTAGLATNLPGGIGVFDTAILLGLSAYLPAPRIVGALVVFRLYYYVIPLFLAGILFTGSELLRGGLLMRRLGPAGTAQALARWGEPDFAVASATGLVALSGVLLLCVGVLAPLPDFSWIDPDFGDVASQAGQFIPSLIGAGLLVVAIGLSQRVNLAWGMTIFLLVAGAAFTATQGERLWIAGALVAVAMLVTPLRRCFYRHASLLSGPIQPGTALWLFGLVICIFALAINRPRFYHRAWWEVVIAHDTPNTLRLTVVMAVLLSLIAIWRLLRPGRVRWLAWDGAARQRLALLGGSIPPARADGVVLGEAEQAGIPFRRCGRVLLGIGDPVGAEGDRVSAIWRLRDLAQQEGLDPAFWRAGPLLLKVYGDLGLTALPLGPDGLPLPESPDETPDAAQYLVCVAERDLKTLLPLLPQLAWNQDSTVQVAA